MYSITHKGKILDTEAKRERAIMFGTPADRYAINKKLELAMKRDALRRYEKETDPIIKEEMKAFIDKRAYNFDSLFGKE